MVKKINIIESNHSLKSRYLYKIIGNAVNLCSGMIVQMVVPRGLGAVQYGNFSFLTDFFMQFMAFLNMGSSIGFYTKLSKRQKEPKLVVFYLMYILLVVGIGFLTVFVVSHLGIHGKLWPGQQILYIYAAVLFAGMMYLTNSMNDVVDARGLTIAFERSRIFQKIAAALFILFVFQLHALNMNMLFYFNYIFFLVAMFFSFYFVRRGGFSVHFQRLKLVEVKAYVKEFYKYSKPLAVLGFVGLGVGLFDRWFLQFMGGGIEQGFYSLSFKVGALCFVFSGAMTQLITREFSIAHEKKDIGEMARLFRRHIPLLYGITALIACFIFVNADKVAVIMGGKEFHLAIIPVAIMAFYPIHQTYGQLSSAVFFATDQVKLYSIVGIIFMVLGVPVTYFLVASSKQYGFGLGAIGLAIKMVLLNIIGNNVLLFFNTRFLKQSFGWYLGHQIISVLVFIFIAWGVTLRVDHWFIGVGILERFLGAGLGYLIVVFGAIYFFPGLLGLTHQDVVTVTNKILMRNGRKLV